MDSNHWILERQENSELSEIFCHEDDNQFKVVDQTSNDLNMFKFISASEPNFDFQHYIACDFNCNLNTPISGRIDSINAEYSFSQNLEEESFKFNGYMSISNLNEAVVLVPDDNQMSKSLTESIKLSQSAIGDDSKNNKLQQDFYSFISDVTDKLKAMQEKIDAGKEFKKGPGRHRKNVYYKSSEIRRITQSYFLQSLKQVVSNRKSRKRKDQMITIFFRKIKKYAFELIKYCATTNLYKRSKISEFSVSFAEAYQGFISCLQLDEEITKISTIRRFVEFITIFFPKDKVEEIIVNLLNSNFPEKQVLLHHLNLLNIRKKTSKTFIQEWVKNSWILMRIFEIVLNVLNTMDYDNDLAVGYLRQAVIKFLTK